MNKRKRKIRNKKLIIIVFIIIAICLISAIFNYRNNLIKTNDLTESSRGLTEEQIENLKDSIKIDSVAISSRITGTAPFDESEDGKIPITPEDGKDYSDIDEYVRTLDTVTYDLNVITVPNSDKEGITGSSIQYGGIIKIKASLPNQGENPNFTWIQDAWMENCVISDDATELYAEYTVPSNQISCPNIINLSFSFEIGGNNKKINKDQVPVFEVWMDGNKPDNEDSKAESYKLVDEDSEILEISSKPSFNIKLEKGDFTQKYTDDYSKSTENNGYYMNFGIACGLAQDNNIIPDLRGLEYPKGDFKVRLKLDYLYSKDGKWNKADENDVNSIGPANGTEIIAYSVNGDASDKYWPKGTSVTSNLPNGRMDIDPNNPDRNVQNSGDFIVEQEGNILTITFKNFDITKQFPTQNVNGENVFDSNSGYFAIGNIQLFAPFYAEDDNSISEYQLNVSVLDASFSTDSVPDGVISSDSDTNMIKDVYQMDNSLNYAMTKNLNNEVSYSLNIRSVDDKLIESTDLAGDGIRGLGDELIVKSKYTANDGPYDGGMERIITWSGDVLDIVKYNENSWYAIEEESELDVPLTTQNNIKVKYGVYKKGRLKGLVTDNEINSPKYDEFEWFDTAEIASQKGKIAAVYIEDPDYNGYRNSRDFIFKFKVIEKESNIGKVAVIKHNALLYADDNKEDLKNEIGEDYNKSIYNENGTINRVHTPRNNGNSILIVDNNVSVTTSVTDLDSSNNPKKKYSINDGVVNYKIIPKLSNGRTKSDGDSYINKVTITNYLPKGLIFKEDSVNKQPSSIVSDPKTGETIITWEYEDWQVNRDAPDFPEITFSANIDMTIDNNSQLENKTVIYTKNDYREEEQYRTSIYGIIIANVLSIQGNKSCENSIVDLNENIVSNIEVSNYSRIQLKDTRILEVLPYNGDENGSDFSGEYNIKIGEIPTGMKVYYTKVVPSLLESKAGLSRDENDRLNPANINFERNTEWIELSSNEEVSNATALVITKDVITSSGTESFSYELIPINSKPGNKYALSANIIATGYPNVLKTNISMSVIAQRKIEGTAWYDTNENGLIDYDEAKASDINIEVIDTSTNDVATDVFDNKIDNIETDSYGNYEIKGLKKGIYKVRFTLPDNTKVTTKAVGDDNTINSKANTDIVDGKVITDELNNLNNDNINDLKNEEYINLGLIHEKGIVKIKYIDKDSGEEISASKSIEGPIGQKYDLSDKELNINGYVRSEDDFEKEGIFTEDTKEITIYYKKETSKVVVKHVLVNPDLSETLLDFELLDGPTGTTYQTERKVYENYQANPLKDEPTNAEGTYTDETQEVIYYYEKILAGEVTIRYVKEITLPDGTNTDVQLETSKVLQGYVGETFETERIEIPTYFQDETKQEPSGTGTFTKDAQEIKYYYRKTRSAGVEVRYIEKEYNEDGISFEEKELMEPTILDGYVGEEYRAVRKNIDNYRAVEPEPTNAVGVFSDNRIIVTFYYEKLPKGQVTVKYLDDTGELMRDEDGNKVEPIIMTDYIGNTYSTSPKTFEGYSLLIIPDNSEGTYTEDSIEIAYIYTRNTYKYKVEYYFENVDDDNYTIDETLTENNTAKFKDIIDSFNSNAKDGFEFSKVEGVPLTISPNESENVIKVYYDRKIYDYTIEYYYENDDGILEQDKLLTESGEAKYGSQITEFRDKNLNGYYLEEKENYPLYISSNTDNNVIRLKYYKERGKVVVRYVDQDTNEEIKGVESKTFEGKIGEGYNVSDLKIDIDNYKYVDDTHNLTGNYIIDENNNNTIYVTFYYKKTGKVITKFVEIRQEEKKDEDGNVIKDPDTGNPVMEDVEVEIRDSVELEDVIGTTVVVSPIAINNYTLKENQESKEVKITKEEQIIKFYYTGRAGGVIERHVDLITGEILEEVFHEGRQGDEYKTNSKTFEGYDLIEELIPSNSEGVMQEDTIEVNYLYSKKAKVVAKYVDERTGKDIKVDGKTLTETYEGHEGDNYNTVNKEIPNYGFTRVDGDPEGVMSVKVNLTPDGDKVFDDTIYITYYYKKLSTGVIEKHIDEVTGEVLYEKTYTGKEGDPYETQSREFSGYDIVENKMPNNNKGTMTYEDITVEYYYIKKAKVEIRFLDIDTNKQIIESIIIEGHEGDPYEAKLFTSKYYEIAKMPDNQEGKMKSEIIKNNDGTLTINDTTYVDFYYKKIKADFKIDQNIISLKINGQNKKIHDGKLEKLEIDSKEIKGSIAEITYRIKVTNSGKIKGNALINVKLPAGLEVLESKGFTRNKDVLERTTDELDPGDSMTYEIKLKWDLEKAKLGTRTSIAEIKKIYNLVNFADSDKNNNISKTELVIATETGKAVNMTIIILITLLILAIMITKTRKRYISNSKGRHNGKSKKGRKKGNNKKIEYRL